MENMLLLFENLKIKKVKEKKNTEFYIIKPHIDMLTDKSVDISNMSWKIFVQIALHVLPKKLVRRSFFFFCPKNTTFYDANGIDIRRNISVPAAFMALYS